MRKHLRVVVAVPLLVTTFATAGDVTILKKLPPRKYPCDLEIFDNQSGPPPAPYEKVAIFAITAFPGPFQSKDEAVMEKFREAACKAGVDAVIVRDQVRGRIDAVGIVFTRSSPDPRATPPSKNSDSRTWGDRDLWQSMSHVERFHFGEGVESGLWAAAARVAIREDRLQGQGRKADSECSEFIDAANGKGNPPPPEDFAEELDEFYSHKENARVDFADAVLSVLLKAEGLPGPPQLRNPER